MTLPTLQTRNISHLRMVSVAVDGHLLQYINYEILNEPSLEKSGSENFDLDAILDENPDLNYVLL